MIVMRKRQKFTVEIPKPCTEDYNLMAKAENGWFCQVCAKEVLDFRDKSDAELREAFKNPGDQPCGVYRPDQVRRPPSGRKSCSVYSNTLRALSLVLAGALAGEGCFMGKRMEPKGDQNHDKMEAVADSTHLLTIPNGQ